MTPTPNSHNGLATSGTGANTDKELWRTTPDDYYSRLRECKCGTKAKYYGCKSGTGEARGVQCYNPSCREVVSFGEPVALNVLARAWNARTAPVSVEDVETRLQSVGMTHDIYEVTVPKGRYPVMELAARTSPGPSIGEGELMNLIVFYTGTAGLENKTGLRDALINKGLIRLKEGE